MIFTRNTIITAVAFVTSTFALADQTNSRLEETVVTANRVETSLREIGSSVSILTEADLDSRGMTNLADALRTLPAINVSNSGGVGRNTALRIRGEENYRTLVLIDGVDISDPTGTQISPDMSQLVSHGIERVEVLRGPQGMMYGADAGGVVAITSKRGKDALSGGLGLEAGRFGTTEVAANLGGTSGMFDYALQASDFETDGFNSQVGDAVDADDDGYENTTIHGNLGAQLNEALRLEFTARNVDSQADFDSCNGPYASCPSDSGQLSTSEYEQSIYRASIDLNLDALAQSLSYSINEVDKVSIQGTYSPYEVDGSIEQIQYLLSANVTENGSLVAGIDYEEQELTSSSSDLEQDQTGVFVEWQQSLSKATFFTAGVRQDDNSEYGNNTSYRATVAHIIPVMSSDELKLKSSYGTGFRAPSPFEVAENNAPWAMPPATDQELKEETSEGVDLGIEYHMANGSYVELVYFQTEIEDEIYYDLATFSGYLQATGTAESKGVEFSTEVPVSDNLRVIFNYTYNETEKADGSTRVRRPEQLANLALRFTSDNDKLRISADVRTVKDTEDEISDGITRSRVALDDYTVLDFTVAYQLTDNVELYSRVENALDEDYEEVTDYNTAGAAAYGGVRLQF